MNILLISSIYPLNSKENKGTSVCHSFAKEWAGLGHNIRVVHFQAVYPLCFYWIAQIASKFISAKTGAVVYTKRDRGDVFLMDGVNIIRMPLFKFIPHGRFKSSSVSRAINKIIELNKTIDFIPDIIVGHFPNPQIEVVARLKDIYPFSTTAIVMHGDVDIPKRIYGKRIPELFDKIDRWGFRSRAVKNSFEKWYGYAKEAFICYSGVPEDYISKKNVHSFEHGIRKFLFVGEFIQRKYPAQILDALIRVFPDKNFIMTYIGSGYEERTIKDKIKQYNIESCVNLLGRIPRERIKDEYDKADCMVMISSGEAYGLVYLEAMARGCITIASKGEGIDGVIENGENGYLCTAGNVDDLVQTIERIIRLPSAEMLMISENAIRTASHLTDKKAATMYLNDLFK